MKKVLIIMIIATVGFTSCDKEETGSTEKTTSEKIVGMWMGDESVAEVVAPPPIGNQTITEDLSYLNVNIKNDGTYTADSSGVNLETGTWSAPSSSTFILDADTFDIRLLTDSDFQFGVDSTFTISGISGSITSTIKLKK